MVSRLLWDIEVSPGDWRGVLPAEAGSVLQDSSGGPVRPADDAPVRLWHPIRARPGEVRAWRDLLTERRRQAAEGAVALRRRAAGENGV